MENKYKNKAFMFFLYLLEYNSDLWDQLQVLDFLQ